MEIPSTNINQSVIALGQLLLQFGQTDRFSYHKDGVTRESDSDHTVMLAILTCACAEKIAPELDRGKIAQFALVHDLVEVHAKDTPTLRPMNGHEKQNKKNREKLALEKIENEFGTIFPWITNTIHEYDSKTTPEARFVKVLDTIAPRITSVLNKGATEREMGINSTELESINQQQRAQILDYISEWPKLIEIWDYLSTEAVRGLESKI
ncbi:HD domain-containing protein [Patescibacteria group bacterium]|nr:MAG: HD domain-containing protein [Patescibacteria group bacterium]